MGSAETGVRRALHDQVLARDDPLPHLPHRLLADLGLEAVEEQHPIEVVALVRETAGEPLGPFDAERLAVHVHAFGHDAGRPCELVLETRDRQAALDVDNALLGLLHDHWIHDVVHLAVAVHLRVSDDEREDAQVDADLRCRQTGAIGILQCVAQVLYEPAEAPVEVGDLHTAGAEHRVAKDPDGAYCHACIVAQGRIGHAPTGLAQRRPASLPRLEQSAEKELEVSDVKDWNARIIEEFRANAGRVGGQFEGAPMLLLHTTGAKTGAERVNPMMYLDTDGHRYVFASKAGADTHPDWYHNLVANPEVGVEVGADTYRATATPVTRADRDRIYAEQARRYPGFADYEAKTSRVIPVVELETLDS